MLRVSMYMFLICLVSQIAFSSQPIKAYSFAPEAGRTVLFIGQDQDTINEYVKATGQIPTGVMIYTSVQEAHGLSQPIDYGSGIMHAQALIEKYPGASVQMGLYMVGALDDILSGVYDFNIDKIGEWIKNSNRLVYVRVGYEFDLPQNRYEPEPYKKAYRYIVDRWRSKDVKASYVWHSYGYLNADKPMMAWYPGDDYVDWFGISFFNAFNDGNVKWMVNKAKAHNKPVMLAESSPFGNSTTIGERSWTMWFKGFFETIEKYDIGAACYINSNWETMPMWQGQGWKDSRVQANALIKERWLKAIENNRFIRSNQELMPLLQQ